MLVQLLVILILTLVNAFFAAAEMSLISIDKKKLKDRAEEGDKKAQTILNITKDQSLFLSTIGVAIILAGFLSSAFAASNLSVYLVGPLERIGVPYAGTISLVLITFILSYFTLVFGELVPKRVALTMPDKFAKYSAGIVNVFSLVMKPFVLLLTLSTNFILRLLGVNLEGIEEKVTLEDLKAIVSVVQEQGVINPTEKKMLDSIIVFDDKFAEEIMTARTEVFMINVSDGFDQYVDDILNLQYSRIPVYEDSVDNIIGILYVKDLLMFLATQDIELEDVDIRPILRPAYFVPERKNINDLFMELKSSRNHFAVLIDEYGGFSGIVTMEDLVEEIVGEIDDEYDYHEPDISKLGSRTYMAKGSVSLADFNDYAGVEIDDSSEDFDSLGGLIICQLGYIPEAGDSSSIVFDDITFTIMDVEENRIRQVKVEIPEGYFEREKKKPVLEEEAEEEN